MDRCVYLAHHGVKGQKWGVRRYQNPDGSLTLEGYKHYYGDNPNARMTRSGVLDYKTGKMLYSNPSKKERKENIRRYKKDKKQYKEELKRARKTGTIKNTSNRTETINRVIKEAQNTEEYRRLDAYDKNLSTLLEQLAKSNGIRPDQIVLSANDPIVKRHIELKKAASDRGKKSGRRLSRRCCGCCY